jgi:hypothetical protein
MFSYLKQEVECTPWGTELHLVGKIFFFSVDNIFMHAINEFKANEIRRFTGPYLLCAFVYLVGLEI